MRYWIIPILFCLALAIGLGSTSSASASDGLATTDELPLALLQLGVEEPRILSQVEADTIRGQWRVRLAIANPTSQPGGVALLNIQGSGSLDFTISTQRIDVRLQIGN